MRVVLVIRSIEFARSKSFPLTHSAFVFDDNTEQTIDFRPILAGELCRPLRNLELFNQVGIDPEVKTLVWPNGADFDPATLHDWPVHEEAFRELARRWEPVTYEME